MRLVKIHKCDIWEPHRRQRQAAAHQTGALLSHTGFLLPDFRKIKWGKKQHSVHFNVTDTLNSDILIRSTTPQQPAGFPWWTEPRATLIYWGVFIIIIIIIMNLFWLFSSIFYEDVRHEIGIFIRGEFIQSFQNQSPASDALRRPCECRARGALALYLLIKKKMALCYRGGQR